MSKAKSNGLGNPAAIAAVPIVGDQVGKAGKAAGQRADKINADTSGALSWVVVGLVILGFYGVWKITAPLRAGAGAAEEALDGIKQSIKDLFTEDTTTGGGNVSNIVDPNFKPPGATITVTQAVNQAAQMLSIFDSFGKLNDSEKQQLYALFLNKTPVDYQMIDAAFGRPYRNNLTGKVGSWASGSRLNLKQWVDAELGSAGVNFLRTITHGIF